MYYDMSKPASAVVNEVSKDTKNHELALEMARFYIEKNISKYDIDKQFVNICSDFYVKYIEAIRTFEAMNRK